MTQGQTERLIRDMREYAEEHRGSVLGDCLDALMQHVADLQGDTMHCPRCEELPELLADALESVVELLTEALELVAAQARAEERYVAQLLDEKHSECPYRQTNEGCMRGWSSEERDRYCWGRDGRGQYAATCWRIWARAEEAAK